MRITNLANIRRAFQSMPWAIHETKLAELTEVLSTRMSDTPLTVEEIQARIGERPTRGMSQQGAVAVIPLCGTLYPKANLVTESSGGCSVEQFIAQVEAAVNDPAVSAIVIDTDSPGGAAQGIPEAAARLRAVRGSKPIVAVASGMMASGAYWLASQADSIVGSPSAEIGSIGAFMVHQDMSQAFANEGVTNTIIRAGKYKAETNPFEPLTEDARAALQTRVDEAYAMFVADVAKGRKCSVATVKADFGQGRVVGAKAALAAGMIDKVGTVQSVVRDLAGPNAKNYLRAADDLAPVLVDAIHTDGEPGAMVLVSSVVPDVVTVSAGSPLMLLPSSDSTPPTAEEPTVDNSTTAPNGATVATPSRELQLSELAALTGNKDKLFEWISSTKTVADVRAELLNAQPSPTVTSAAATVTVGAMRETQKPWAHFGEQLQAVMKAGTPGVRDLDPRLFAAASGMSQGVPAEGGFLVAPEFSTSIWENMSGAPDAVLPLTDNYTVTGESLTFNADAETSRATGSRRGGIQAYWMSEAAQYAGSKPKFRQVRIEPQDLGVFVYLTDKLVNNSPVALAQYVSRCASDEISTMVTEAIINGNGVGQPLGIMNGTYVDGTSTRVRVSKETSQAAATLNQQNISKMWARLHPRLRAGAVWLINADVEPALDTLSTVVQNVAGTENVGGYANKVFDSQSRTIKGRPVMVCESCQTLGTEGDVILWAPQAYLTGTRGGVKEAMSMHLRFDYNEQAYRFIFSVDGQPWHISPITPLKGTNYQSSIVTLQTR